MPPQVTQSFSGVGKLDAHVSETADGGGDYVVVPSLMEQLQPQAPDGTDGGVTGTSIFSASVPPAATIPSTTTTNLRGSLQSVESIVGDIAPPLATTTLSSSMDALSAASVGPKSMETFARSLQGCTEATKLVFVGDSILAKMRQQPTGTCYIIHRYKKIFVP